MEELSQAQKRHSHKGLMGGSPGSTQDLTDLEAKVELLSTYHFVPLSMSTKEKEVIILVVSNGEGGLSIDDQRLEASLMYQAKNH
jgi:hypothetical protein